MCLRLCDICTYRLGGGETDAEEVKTHIFFESISWDELYKKKIAPPFVPVIKSEQSADYFDKEFTDENPDLTPPDESMPLSSPSLLCLIRLCAVVIFPLCHVAGDPKAHVGDGVHFHDFTFVPEAGGNFK